MLTHFLKNMTSVAVKYGPKDRWNCWSVTEEHKLVSFSIPNECEWLDDGLEEEEGQHAASVQADNGA